MRADDLYHNKIKSCGCYKKPQYKDIKNKKFGKLMALEYKYTINKKAYWLCECDCGNIVVVSSSNLNSKHTSSCGCLRRNNKIEDNDELLKKHFRNLLKDKVLETLKYYDYKCYLTDTKENLEVHHLQSFSTLYIKVFDTLNLPIYNNIKDYTIDQQHMIDNLFLNLHTKNMLIVITKKVHIKFHKLYGYKNNTEEQFNDFINKYFPNRSTLTAI